jgi:hypothetical protein
VGGIAVAGELTQFSGPGEGARPMSRRLEVLGVANRPVDASALLPTGASRTSAGENAVPPAGMPLVIHVNPPLPPAMLLAKPVIATGWSGNMTFMDQRSAALVDHRLVAVNDPRQVYRNSTWAEPDQGQAVSHLRHLADHAEARAALGARAKVQARKKFTIEPLAVAVRSLELSGPRRNPPP